MNDKPKYDSRNSAQKAEQIVEIIEAYVTARIDARLNDGYILATALEDIPKTRTALVDALKDIIK